MTRDANSQRSFPENLTWYVRELFTDIWEEDLLLLLLEIFNETQPDMEILEEKDHH